MRNKHMQKLLKLLDAENAIIRRGDLGGLPNLAQQKELLMQDIGQLRGSMEDVTALRTAAQRNMRLLAAAIAGVKDARQRLAALEDVHSGLSIYDAQGDRQTVAGKGGSLEHKA